MIRRLQYKAPKNISPQEIKLSKLYAGLNISYFPSFIGDTQSPQMKNLNADDRGSLRKRNGWTSLYSTSLADEILGLSYYDGKYVFSSGTKLYKLASTDVAPVELLSGLTKAHMNFFEFNGILYGINGAEYIQYDGTTAKVVAPYIPTTYINRLYSGGGDAYENINRIGAGFTNTFNGDNSHTTFLLSAIGLDATTVTCSVDGVTKTENTHFTVNRANGTIDFSAGSTPNGAPTTGTNNVIITAYKTSTVNNTSIVSNHYFTSYGGENDTRIFLCGNGNYVFYSALLDPSYWPYNNYNRLGDPSEVCTGFSKLFDMLVVFKSKEIYSMTYLNESNIVSFPTKLLNSFVGCDMPKSIQMVNDMPVFANSSKGVYVLFSGTGIKEEKNVKLISDNINGAYSNGLLNFSGSDLLTCSSVDYDNKYWICVKDEVYVWDYNLSPYIGLDDGGKSLCWFYYTNINAVEFAINTGSNNLAFGDRTTGMIKEFSDILTDDGVAINAIWKSKLFAFSSNNIELTDWYKDILEMWLTSRALGGDSITVSYYTERESFENDLTITASELASFQWDKFDFSAFSWGVSNYTATIHKIIKLKGVQYFQLGLSNNEINEDLSIVYISIRYNLTKRIK
jgi:hypothetical protein